MHTPGTALEDQYGNWNEYVERLRAEKEVVVVGVTDYLSIHNYRKLRGEQIAKPLGSITLLIPNIEFRLGPETAHGHAINLHLLIDPSESQHCQRIEEALSRLSIDYQKQKYSCNEVGLRGLGAAYKSSLADDVAKYAEGVNQYKIDPAAFNGWYESEKWLSSNSIVVISGGNDGPSGLKEDGWAAVQEELWRFAQAVFSGNPKNRLFWLAEDTKNDNGAIKLGAPKPCLHGSDAHEIAKLFCPDDDRSCWIKGDPTFERGLCGDVKRNIRH